MLTYCSLDILNKLYECLWHKPFIAYMWHVMACRLMNAKPFHVPMQTYCSMDLFEHTIYTYMVWAVYCLCVTLPGLHWGLLPFRLVKIDTCDGLSPDQWRAITWTTADLLFIETFWKKLRLYFAETITIVICYIHKDIIKQKRFLYCCASVRGSHWSLVGYSQWSLVWVFPLVLAWTSCMT